MWCNAIASFVAIFADSDKNIFSYFQIIFVVVVLTLTRMFFLSL